MNQPTGSTRCKAARTQLGSGELSCLLTSRWSWRCSLTDRDEPSRPRSTGLDGLTIWVSSPSLVCQHRAVTSKQKLVYLVSTGLLSAMMLMHAVMSVVNPSHIREEVAMMGFPSFIIYPLAVAKVLGVAAIWSHRFKELRGLAYAGFFYNFILALGGHMAAGDGEFFPPVVALALLGISYWGARKL